jgi:Mg-chelatase subunit ChlD
MTTRARARNLVEKARSTPHAAEAQALLDKAAEILAKEGATLADLDAPASPVKTPRTALAKRPRRKPPAAGTPEAPVVVSGLIDESGSMADVREATIAGYNGFLDKLQAELGQTRSYVSTLLFDRREGHPLVRPLAVGQPIDQAARLSMATYAPTGMTPLYDAIAETVRATDEVVAREKATRVFLVLQTDGGENASRDFAGEPGRARIAAMLEERKRRGWQIVFLAADLADQGYRMGAGLGIGPGQTIAYGKDRTFEAFDVVAASASGYLRGAASQVAFSALQKEAAGDPIMDPRRGGGSPATLGAGWPHATPGPGPGPGRWTGGTALPDLLALRVDAPAMAAPTPSLSRSRSAED